MNNVWKIVNFEKNIYQQNKVIYAIDKFSSSVGCKTIVIGFDNREKSEKIAETIAKGLSSYQVILINKSVSSSLLTVLLKEELYDLSLYITGDYSSWNTYGFKLKFKHGRTLSLKESKQIKEYLDGYHDDKTYRISYNEKVYRGNFDDHYLQHFGDYYENKKLNANICFNILGYSNGRLSLKLFNKFGCTISPFMSAPHHDHSPNPTDKSMLFLSRKLLKKTDCDFCITNTDGELLTIQTKKHFLDYRNIALMLLDISKDKIKQVVSHDENDYIKNLCIKNNIKYVVNHKKVICNTPNSLLVTNNHAIIDSNFAFSMDANHIILTIIEYLNQNNITIDDYYESLIEKYQSKPA